MEKYGNPITFGGGQSSDLPPLLDNFKVFEGGGIDDGLTRLKDLPNGTKVKFGTYNNQTLVWRIAQDKGVTKAILDLDYDTGKTIIGDMVVSPANSICGNWAITGWLNATEAGGSWWANRVHYEDTKYPETEPTYSNQDGFLYGWSESDRGLLQNIEWGCDDFILGGSPEPYQLNCKLIICSEDEAYAAWNGERFCVGFGADTPVILRDYSTGAGGYSGISGMGNNTMEGAVYKDELSSAIGIWPVCAPNPEAVVSDEPDDDGCYTIDYTKRTVGDLQVGDKIKVSVNADAQSFLGENIVFQVAAHNHPTHPENSATLITEKIIACMAVDAAETSYPNGNPNYSLSNLNQWLNSNAGAGQWWSATHDGDVAPAEGSVDYNPYSQRAGFLSMLDSGFVKSLLETHRVQPQFDDVIKSETDAKVFNISLFECGGNIFGASGVSYRVMPLFEPGDSARLSHLTQEAISNSEFDTNRNPSSHGYSHYWWCCDLYSSLNIAYVRYNGSVTSAPAALPDTGDIGIRPACNISNSLPLVSSTPDEEGCYLVDWNKINVTIQADKMEESRAEQLAGAVWVYGDHIPKNVNDGTKIQLTREEIVRPDGEIYITLSDIPASDADIETVVNIKESDGQLHPYLYLSNNYEDSGAALLLRKDVYQKGQFYAAVNPYNGCSLDKWCENTFLTSVLDSFVQNQLVSVNIQVQGSYISRRCFALSIVEYGWGTNHSEGTALPYFKDDKTRISLYQGSSADYYTRTYQAGSIWFIGLMGNAGTESGTLSLGYRPAICIKKSFKIKSTPNEDGSYDMYDEVSDISTFASSEFVVEKQVSWEQTKDFYARQFTYNSKKQYQTMLEGAILKNIPSQLITNLSSNDKIKIGRYNNESMQWRLTKDTVTNDLYVVLEPISVKSIGKMIFDNPEPENSDEKRKLYGNNRYIFSNVHQWLNTDGLENQWYAPQHSVDTPPPYSNKKGFLNEWNDLDKKSILTNTYTVTKASMDGGGTETFESKLCLMSTSEIGIKTGTGGNKLDIFNSDEDRKMDDWYFLRSPYYSLSDNINIISSTGILSSYRSDMEGYIRPMFKINTKMLVSLEKDSDDCYNIKGVEE